MSRKIVSVTLDNADELPLPCRTCTRWELGRRDGGALCKDDWLSAVLLEWGSCGRVLYVDGQVAGFALYAPPAYVAGTTDLHASEVSPDAILLMTARILPPYRGAGLGRVLLQAVVKDALSRRGVKALEAFGDLQASSYRGSERDPLVGGCVVPADFLSAVGFKTVGRHLRYPRLRLDLRNVLSWREDVEVALERWLGAMRPERAVAPLGVSARTDAAGSD